MRGLLLSVMIAAVGLAGCQSAPIGDAGTAVSPEPITRIGFGSCARQRPEPQAIWRAAAEAEPDVFILLGDNVYADTDEVDQLRADYAMLAADPGFGALREGSTVLATWDDHDYGRNDAGAEFEAKAASQEAFLDMFDPDDAWRRKTPGVYDAAVFGPAGRRVQVILLDTRYFRGPLARWPKGERPRGQGPYVAAADTGTTMLGEAQWRWLERRLREPADLRVIASSIQFIAEDHHWEKWANLPHERRRMIDLIERAGAAPVLFLTGDRHLSEISMIRRGPGAGLIDVTSSSLTHSLSPREEPNRHRVGEPVFENNFGLIEIDWSNNDVGLKIQFINAAGETIKATAASLGSHDAGAGPDPDEPRR